MNISRNRLIGARAVGDGSYQLVFPGRVVTIAAPAKSIPATVRWSLLLLIFMIPFEGLQLGLPQLLSPARIAVLLFFGFFFLNYGPFSGKRSFPHVPSAMKWFLGYLAVYVLNGFFLPTGLGLISAFLEGFLKLVELIVLFWILSDLLKDAKTARSVLLVFSIASAVLAVGTVLGLPGFSVSVIEGEEGIERTEAMGFRANSLGALLALAGVTLIGLGRIPAFRGFMSKISLPLLILPLLAGMVLTGSRTGAGMFMIGCSVYLLPSLRSKQRLTAVILAIFGIFALVYMVASNPDFLTRWEVTYYGGIGVRERIAGAAIDMILERPIFGWQPVLFWSELGANLGKGKRDAHNLFLHLLLEVGAVGAIPFFVGLWLCGWAAWKSRGGLLGLLPLALMLATLAANMAHTQLEWRFFWLVLALALGAAPSAATGWRKRSAAPVVGRPFRSAK